MSFPFLVAGGYVKVILLSQVLMHSLLIFPPQDVTTQTISWTSSKVTEVAHGTVSSEPHQVVVYQKERMEWIDAKGVKKYALIILSSKGSLQVEGQGEIIYQVTGEKIRGNVTIRKTSAQTIIKIVLVEDNKPSIYELVISGYTLL